MINMNKYIAIVTILLSLGLILQVAQAKNNSFPVWDQISDKSVIAGQTIQFTVNASDPDGDALSYQIVNLPKGATFNSSSRIFNWNPNEGQVGGWLVWFKVSDGQHLSEMMIYVSVISSQQTGSANTSTNVTNDDAIYYTNYTASPTFLSFNPSLTATEGVLYNYQIQAASNNGSMTKYRLTDYPGGMFINETAGLIAWVPNENQGRAEPYQVTVVATNGQWESSRTFYITVNDVQTSETITNNTSGNKNASVPTSGKSAKEVIEVSDVVIEAKDNGDIVVSWNTNLPTRDRIIYDIVSEADRTSDYEYAYASSESDELSKNHEVNLGKLDVGQTYYFRIVSKTDKTVKIGQERIFVRLADGAINDLGLASAFTALGSLLFSPGILFIVIIILGFMLYRARKKSDLI
ncbi:MAG: putative Ig domain-containing protein [bacterium]|nr:putative Ig domain-containing protein [bacterium]